MLAISSRVSVAMPGKQLFGKCWEHPEPTEGGVLSPYEQETHNTLLLYLLRVLGYRKGSNPWTVSCNFNLVLVLLIHY